MACLFFACLSIAIYAKTRIKITSHSKPDINTVCEYWLLILLPTGRRFAELQLYSLLLSVVPRYKLSTTQQSIQVEYSSGLVAMEPVSLTLEARWTQEQICLRLCVYVLNKSDIQILFYNLISRTEQFYLLPSSHSTHLFQFFFLHVQYGLIKP